MQTPRHSSHYGYVVLCDQCHGKKFLADGVMCWKCNGVGDQLWERLPYIAAVLLLLFLAM
jgi:DnaJ-class molecular chaperone